MPLRVLAALLLLGGRVYALVSGNWRIGAIAFGLGAALLGFDRLQVARGRPERAIGWVLVPFWRGTSPADFRRWFTTHSDRIRRLMGPLGGGATVLTAASAALQLGEGRRPAATSLTAAAATAGVVAITLAVNEPANHRFTGGTLTDAETEELLRRWGSWHRVRVALGVLATVAATVAVTRTDQAGRGPHP